MRRQTLVIVAALSLGCRASAPPASAPAAAEERVPFVVARVGPSVRVDWRVPPRDGQLSDSQLVALAPRIAQLRAEPDTLRMDVVDSLFIGQLVRVLAIDDSGAVLGEVRRYDFRFGGSLYPLPSGAVRGTRAGTGYFGAHLSARLAGEFRTRGPAQVWVVMTDSTGAGQRMLQISKGSGVISGVVRDSLGLPFAGANVQAMKRVGNERLPMARAITDTQGRFRLDSLPAGEATLMATGPGHQLFIGEVPLSEGDVVAYDMRLLPLRTAIQVNRPPGRP